MAAVPSIGRAGRVEPLVPHEASATQSLYERYANQIFGYCLHQLGSREEAEDAVQSTFLNAFRGLSRGIVPEQESAWLFKIANNVCLSRRRSTWRRGRIESPADFDLVEELTPAPSRRADELIGLQDVLEQMPENQRRAILLREWQGLSYREIADELELSQSAVETLIFRARRALAQGLEQPPEPRVGWRRRIRTSANLGGLFTWLKSLVGGVTAAKVAGTAAVVAVSSVAATAPLERRPHHATSAAPVAVKRASTRRPVAVSPQLPPVIAAGATVERPRTTTATPAPSTRHARPARRKAALTPPSRPAARDATPPASTPAPAPAPAPTPEPPVAAPPAAAPPAPPAENAAPAPTPRRQTPPASGPAQPAQTKSDHGTLTAKGDDKGGKDKGRDKGKANGSASGGSEKEHGNGNGKSKAESPAPPAADPPAPVSYQPAPVTSPAPATVAPEASSAGAGNGNGKDGEHGNPHDGGSKGKSK